MNRLVSENCGDSRISYKYDLSGNRISRDTDGRTENYLYNSRNQLTQLTGDDKNISYTYDPAGNLTVEHSTEHKKIYSYDTYNRNTEINGNDFTQKNHYDAEGYRYSIEENDKVTNFVYRCGIMLAELDEAGNQAKTYTLGNEYAGHVSELNNSLTSENKAASYYITDEQGSIRYILDQSGEVLNFYQYSAFGETIISEETTPNRLRYNAQTEDELTGLYYLRARYYAPNIGRFTQEDVIYNDGLNLYAYCNSNPVMYSDPSGFAKETCKSKVGGECGSETSYGKSSSNCTELVPYYPANNGAVPGTEKKIYLMAGDKIDRFGGKKGKFFSPTGTPMEMRALPYDADLSQYRQFEVVKPFEVEASTIAPAFGNIGLGTQYRSSVSVDVLLKKGIIKQVGGNF